MADTFFDPGDQRAARVHALFARIAPRYDLINDLQSLGLHRLKIGDDAIVNLREFSLEGRARLKR